jgi:ubiquinone/menaquinone biosynthesis C-methylase UbiE
MESTKYIFTAPKILLQAAVDDLESLHQDVYTTTSNTFVHALKTVPGVLMVCSYGSVSFPGISDLDIWVVVEDEYFLESEKRIQYIARSLPHGEYLFAHQIFVVPKTLLQDVQLLFMSHILASSEVLYGNADLLKNITPVHDYDKAISMALWCTTLWRVVWGIQQQKNQSIRKLLLTLQVCVIQTSQMYQFLGKDGESQHILHWGREVRLNIWNAHGEERMTRMNTALDDALEQWTEVQWAFQQWWEQAGQWKEGVPREDVPSFTSDLVAQVSNVFSPHLETVTAQSYTQEHSNLHLAVQRYTHAVERAKQWAQKYTGEQYTLFLHNGKGMFPSPFNYVPMHTQYDMHGKAYIKEIDESLPMNSSPSSMALRNAIGINIEGKSLLDVGCGTGDDLAYFQAKRAHVFGIDIASTMIAAARDRHPTLHNLYVGTMKKMPFDDNAFDIVCSKYSMHYNEKLDPSFLEIARVLKPGGMLICVEAHPLLGFVQKKERVYHTQIDFPIPLAESSLYAPSHVFAEYLSNAVLENFTLCSVQEGEDAQTGIHDEKVPFFLVLTMRKR